MLRNVFARMCRKYVLKCTKLSTSGILYYSLLYWGKIKAIT